jgi:hypothetical protein
LFLWCERLLDWEAEIMSQRCHLFLGFSLEKLVEDPTKNTYTGPQPSPRIAKGV